MRGKSLVVALVALIGVWMLGCGEDDGPTNPSTGSSFPQITAPTDTSVAYGDTLHLSVSAWHPRAVPLTFSVAVIASLSEIRTGYRASAHIDRQSGAFWFYPGPRDVPSRSFQFSVTDNDGNSDETICKVTVN